MMSPTTYTTMLKFTAEALIDLFFERYSHEYGEKKAEIIIQRIKSSEKVINYIKELINRNLILSPKQLAILMNSIGYFLFSKGETLCLGGLAVIYRWKELTNPFGEKYAYEEPDKELVMLCADFIIFCGKTKTNITNNFFSRFYSEINRIGREEEP